MGGNAQCQCLIIELENLFSCLKAMYNVISKLRVLKRDETLSDKVAQVEVNILSVNEFFGIGKFHLIKGLELGFYVLYKLVVVKVWVFDSVEVLLHSEYSLFFVFLEVVTH